MKSFALKSLSGLLALTALSLTAGCPSVKPDPSESQSATPAPVAQWKVPSAMPVGAEGEKIAYGKRLIAETPVLLGPAAAKPELRLAGNNLSCTNCHLANGTQANAMGFVGIAKRFPAYYAPLDREVTLSERVQACFERSLNGKKLPEPELEAYTAYLSWLSQEVPDGQIPPGTGLPELNPPTRAADLKKGKELYAYHCAACHGNQGEGAKIDDANPGKGYSFPPVWGKDSFSQGSNMARLLVATRYIRSNMPLGRPVLRPEEAYDIAGYMLSQPRPEYSGAGKDYPNPKTRPVDVPYGPYPDKLPASQHRLGPFPAGL